MGLHIHSVPSMPWLDRKKVFMTKRKQRSETDDMARSGWASMYESILIADSDMIIQGLVYCQLCKQASKKKVSHELLLGGSC